jgi:hypothetical protein
MTGGLTVCGHYFTRSSKSNKGEVAEWGDASDATACNAVNVGSIPTFASIPFPPVKGE